MSFSRSMESGIEDPSPLGPVEKEGKIKNMARINTSLRAYKHQTRDSWNILPRR